jgi:AcrR family transcriptional regulator
MPPTLRRGSSKDVLLDAAEAVVRDAGAAHLTLDAVAAKAGVSKGGLLYHFPSKQALLAALVARVLARFDAAKTRVQQRLRRERASALKAYVLAGLADGMTPDRISAALVAAAAENPRLGAPVRERLRSRLAEMVAAGFAFERAAAVMFAVDGLWLAEMLQISPLAADERRKVVAEMLRLAGEAQR